MKIFKPDFQEVEMPIDVAGLRPGDEITVRAIVDGRAFEDHEQKLKILARVNGRDVYLSSDQIESVESWVIEEGDDVVTPFGDRATVEKTWEADGVAHAAVKTAEGRRSVIPAGALRRVTAAPERVTEEDLLRGLGLDHVPGVLKKEAAE